MSNKVATSTNAVFRGRNVHFGSAKSQSEMGSYDRLREREASCPSAPRRYDQYEPPPDMRHTFQREPACASSNGHEGLPNGLIDNKLMRLRHSQNDSPASLRGPFSPLRPTDNHGHSNGSGQLPSVSTNQPINHDSNLPFHRNVSWTKQNQSAPMAAGSGMGSAWSTGGKTIPRAPAAMRNAHTHYRGLFVFISSSDLPAKPEKLKFLRSYFSRYDVEDVLMYPDGFYVIFSDTQHGRKEIVRCAAWARDALVYNQNRLNPKVFCDGKQIVNTHTLLTPTAAERTVSELPGTSILSDERHSRHSSDSNAAVTLPEPTTNSFTPRPLSDSPESKDSTECSPAPPKASGRARNDDNSSIRSGTTSSDRSRAAACHVCRGMGGKMSLCKTCLCHYHSHCRPLGSAPETEHVHWQCVSCKGKGKSPMQKEIREAHEHDPRRHLNNDIDVVRQPSNGVTLGGTEVAKACAPTATNEATLASGKLKRRADLMESEGSPASHDSTEVPPTKKVRIEGSELEATDCLEQPVPGTLSTETMSAGSSSNLNGHTLAPSIVSDDNVVDKGQNAQDNTDLRSPVDEAQKLVEQSFASTVRQDSGAREPRKLKFTRVKRPKVDPSSAAVTGANSARDRQSSADEGRVAHDTILVPPSSSPMGTSRQGHMAVMLNEDTTSGVERSIVPAEPGESHHELLTTTTAPAQLDSDASKAATTPADSVLETPAIIKPTGQARARRSRITAMRCSTCAKNKVPYNPTGKAQCSTCRQKAAAQPLSAGQPDASLPNPDRASSQARSASNGAAVAMVSAHDHASGTLQDCSKGQKEESERLSEEVQGHRPLSDKPSPELVKPTFPKGRRARSPALDMDPYKPSGEDLEVPAPVEDLTHLGHADGMPQESVHAVEEDDIGVVRATPEKHTVHRETQPMAGASANDLGNSYRRPPNTYMRLIGMALCAHKDHAATPQEVVKWIDENIPGYHLGSGIWAKGVQATMCMNVNNSSGRPILTRADNSTKTEQEPNVRKIYSLLPGVHETLEHWDAHRQQPIWPAGALGKNAHEAPAVEEKRNGSPAEAVQEDLQNVMPPGNRRQRRDSAAAVASPSKTSQARQTRSAAPVAAHEVKSAPAAASADRQDPERPFLSDEEEQRLLEMIEDDSRTRVSSSKSLFADRPQYDPNSDAVRHAKMAEIARRPRRKQIFGSAPGHSVCGYTPILPPICSSLQQPGTARDEAESPSKRAPRNHEPAFQLRRSVADGVRYKEYERLEDFLGLPEDLVPAVVDKQLVYRRREGNQRILYKTRI